MPADELARTVTLDLFCPGVPRDDMTAWIEQEDRVVLNCLDEKAKALVGGCRCGAHCVQDDWIAKCSMRCGGARPPLKLAMLMCGSAQIKREFWRVVIFATPPCYGEGWNAGSPSCHNRNDQMSAVRRSSCSRVAP